jgi:hypothetical protein
MLGCRGTAQLEPRPRHQSLRIDKAEPGLYLRISPDRIGKPQVIVFGHIVHKRKVESIADIITPRNGKNSEIATVDNSPSKPVLLA